MTPRSYNLKQVFNLKRQIESDVDAIAHIGWELRGDRFKSFVSAVHAVMPDTIDRDTIEQSVTDLLGKELTPNELHKTAWRLAGNLKRLRSYQPAPLWTRQLEDEWVPALISRVETTPDKRNRKAYKVTAKILAGSPASMQVSTVWSKGFCFARGRPLGFTKSNGKYPMHDPVEFTNLRMTILISSELSIGSPMFDKLLDKESAAVLSYNRKLLSMRQRTAASKFSCPQGFTHACFNCPIGFDSCPAAVHEKTFEGRKCKNCEKIGWFDPARPHKFCMECVECEKFKIKAEKE